MLSFAILAMLAGAELRSFYCKHALQNTQNDCYQWFSHSFRVHQIRPPLGSIQCSPESLAGLRGPTSKGRGRMGGERWEDKGRTGGGRKGSVGDGREVRGPPPYANSWIRPCFMSVVSIPKQPGLIPPWVGYPTPRLYSPLKLIVHTRVLEYSTRHSIQSRVVIKLLNSCSLARGGRS